MSLYLDTSVLVAVFIPEAHSDRVERWLRQRENTDDLIASGWVVTEFSGALSNKLRRRDINEEQRVTALGAFSQLCVDNLKIVSVPQDSFHRAARIADQHELGMRAADALHLAIAFAHGATLCTLDRRLSAAGPPLGVATLLV